VLPRLAGEGLVVFGSLRGFRGADVSVDEPAVTPLLMMRVRNAGDSGKGADERLYLLWTPEARAATQARVTAFLRQRTAGSRTTNRRGAGGLDGT